MAAATSTWRPSSSAAADEEIVNIIRMQKWGVHEHLDEGKGLLDAMLEADEYTEYIFDRRLGMPAIGHESAAPRRRPAVGREILGRRAEYHGRMIWSTYFQRDYIRGIASDKIPTCRFEDPAYAARSPACWAGPPPRT